MPELPEVETIKRGLAQEIEQAVIIQAKNFRPNLRYPFPENICNVISNQTIVSLQRRAKYLLFNMSNGYSIISHLGMSGSWLLQKTQKSSPELFNSINKHDHFLMLLRGKTGELYSLTYNDPRRFGFMLYHNSEDLSQQTHLKKLGVEPLSEQLKGEYLWQKLRRKNCSFKAALLDQTIIAGLGNIYVCEALWRSSISPFAKVNEFCQLEDSQPSLDILCQNIKDILQEALVSGGSTLRDYKNSSGKAGYFQHNFAVYNRAGKKCQKCENQIERAVQNGRSSFFCSFCQAISSNNLRKF